MKNFEYQEVRTIREIFNNTLFVIPSFQRPYEWKEEMCEELFADILDAFDNRKHHDDEKYFVGSLVMYAYARRGKDDDELSGNSDADSGTKEMFKQRQELEKEMKGQMKGLLKVVDGQQRLTSLLILLLALRDCELKSGGKNGDGDLRYALDCLVTGCKSNRGGKNPELVRIRTNVLEDEEFQLDLQKMYDAQGDGLKLDLINSKSKRLENYKLFKELIEEKWGSPTAKGKNAAKNYKERQEFAKFIMDNVQLLELVCANREDAIKLFEVVNSRGLELSPASIMKPRVVSDFKRSDAPAVLKLWDRMSDEKEKNFLVNLFLYLRAIRKAEGGSQDDSKQSIADYFTGSGKDGHSLKENFVTLRKMYAIHCFAKDPKFIVLRSIIDKFPLNLHRPAFYKFLLDLFESKNLFREKGCTFEFDIGLESDYSGKDMPTEAANFREILRPAYEFCELIIRFYLENMLTGQFTRDRVRGKFRQLVVDVAKNGPDNIAHLSEVLFSDKSQGLNLKDALEGFKTRDCYEEMPTNLSFVLVWLCTYLKYRDNEVAMESYSKLFIDDNGKRLVPDREHVHPKDWSKCDGWTQEEHDKKTNLLGNLIPLELEINRTAGNDSLRKKVTGEGQKRGSKSKLTYDNSFSPAAKEIAEEQRQCDFKQLWLPERIDQETESKIELLKDFLDCKD